MRRNDNRANEAAVLLYHNVLSKKREEISKIIAENVQRHTNWNKGWVDATWISITPPLDYNITTKPRTCGRFVAPTKVAYLEPKLLSVSEKKFDTNSHYDETLAKFYPDTKILRNDPSMQRRRGRGGRFLLDRRHSRSLSSMKIGSKASQVNEPFQFRRESKGQCSRGINFEYHDNGIYHANLYEDSAIRYRVMISSSMYRDSNAQTVLSTSVRS